MKKIIVLLVILFFTGCEKTPDPTLTIVNKYADSWLTVIDMSNNDTLTNEIFLYNQERYYFFEPESRSTHSVQLVIDIVKYPADKYPPPPEREPLVAGVNYYPRIHYFQIGLNHNYPYILVIKPIIKQP